MNQFVPDWNMDDDSRSLRDLLAASNQKKTIGADNELIELLWQNGHVVMQSQTHRKPPAVTPEFKQVHKDDESVLKSGVTFANTSNLTQDETVPWFQYPLEDSIGKDFYSEFFFDMPNATDEERPGAKFGAAAEGCVVLNAHEKAMPPPKSHSPSVENDVINFSHFSKQLKSDLGASNPLPGEKRLENRNQGGAGVSSSMMTVGSSVCISNQVQIAAKLSHIASGNAEASASRSLKEDVHTRLASQEAAAASSSGGSGCSFGRTGQRSNKRKGREMEEFESHGEDAENESAEANNQAQRSTSTRRSRAAEVHNLSERRRRDRINEKMRALQELIPHCNKSDKASVLDEAIEYLKSLQLQVQFLWMGTGMAPMMFPGVHQFMSRMGPASIPSPHSPIQMPRVPYMNNQFVASTSTANAANFPTQMPNVPLRAGLLGLNHIQLQSQPTNCNVYGPQMSQQNQSSAEPSSGALPVSGVSPSESAPRDKSG